MTAAAAGCGGGSSSPIRTSAPSQNASAPETASLSQATARETDLDGDGADETVWLGRGPGAVWIVDGQTTYRARDIWQVRAATLGDTDRDGLPEVVALLEDSEGLHVGLFAWRRDRYRERLVTSPIVPRPTSLRVRYDAASRGDVIDLGEGTAAVSTYRWNGFGFTGVEGAVAGR